jgi:hypothetical protein
VAVATARKRKNGPGDEESEVADAVLEGGQGRTLGEPGRDGPELGVTAGLLHHRLGDPAGHGGPGIDPAGGDPASLRDCSHLLLHRERLAGERGLDHVECPRRQEPGIGRDQISR